MPDRMGLGMEIDAQVDSLVHFLNNFDENHQKALDLWRALTEWIDYWTKGDFDSFASMEGWDEFLALNPGDVLSRNEKWLPVMKNAMSESPTMFVFGAAHLVGKEGVIYVGFPIWWYTCPTIINTFMEAYNFQRKTVIPFATSGGSSIKKACEDLKTTYPNINWKEGKLLNHASKDDLKKWVERNL